MSLNKVFFVSFVYFILILMVLIPTLIVLGISLSRSVIGVPPFSQIFSFVDGMIFNISLYFGNFYVFFSDSFYFSAILSSIKIAIISTTICLLIGYPFAYAMKKASAKNRIILLLMIALPFVTPFLIRVYALMTLLHKNGLVNLVLTNLGIIKNPLHILDSNFAIILGIVYCYLPFMIFPIYTALEKIDDKLIEASLDLGASPLRAFWSITLPNSFAGIVAGFTLVFVPAIGEFVIPEILGGAKNITIGQTIWMEFFSNRDWPLACSIAVLLLSFFLFYNLLSRIKKSLIKK